MLSIFKRGVLVQLFMTELDYHYFKLGCFCIGYINKPSSDNHVRKINILKEEVIQDLGERRLLLKKSC
ncbi:hypothetical protein BN990_04272 [Virgibacillus salexigens]|uniref:Uncharacterized protein n=1 Tax=Virgibacillus massiliensis TaxID=1462526 RepID=A0A024QH57_9BACI|nr:hypothetical protein BN990_04272 [Virgibacillus massiliensis]